MKSDNNDRTRGFVKLQRSGVTEELLGHPSAFHLLTVIAYRARFSDERSLDGLSFGQALIGDHKKYGLTRKQDRCARRRLEKWGLVKFEGNPKGTIATLLDSRVFSLRDERESEKQGHQQGHLFSEENPNQGASNGAIEGPPRGQHGATNQNGKKDRMSSFVPATADTNEPIESKKGRRRDALFDTLAAACGLNSAELTKDAATWIGTALAQIRTAMRDASSPLTTAEIERRAANYRLQHPDWELTPSALAKYWAGCGNPPMNHRAYALEPPLRYAE